MIGKRKRNIERRTSNAERRRKRADGRSSISHILADAMDGEWEKVSAVHFVH